VPRVRASQIACRFPARREKAGHSRTRRSRNGVTFPKLPEFQQVTLKVLRWEERDKRLVIKDAEVAA
jgi:hypothetical protein